jgi:hypothetical protein
MPLSGIFSVAKKENIKLEKCFRMRYHGEWTNESFVLRKSGAPTGAPPERLSAQRR